MTQIVSLERKGSRVSSVARELIAMSLAVDDGAFLGGEDELILRLGASRLTLRQAAKIAEHQHMIKVRRGNKGGFYASRPSAADAVQSLAGYLHLKGTNLKHMLRIAKLVSEESGAIAAKNNDEGFRKRLQKISADAEKVGSRYEVISRDIALSETIAEMSCNPLIEIINAIVNAFGIDEESTIFVDPAERDEISRLQKNVCDAILSGDAEVARLMLRRRADALAQWLSR
jgi:DNA-binding FadR family transcriptional regulator